MRPVLRQGDGWGNTTPHLRDHVRLLQRRLAARGYDVDEDGLFGAGTERAVIAFQRAEELVADGIVGPATWRALDPRARRPRHPDVPGLASFRGDLDWLHGWEGHEGRPYFPGGRSGVTLDPGFDLAQQSYARAVDLYGALLDRRQRSAIRKVARRDVYGRRAWRALQDPVLRGIRISVAVARRVMPLVAVEYWTPIVRRFPRLVADDTPGSVQTALLSLSYNRGPRNRDLQRLTTPLARGRWLQLADRIAAMQQDHPLPGIRRRRRSEAELIREEVE